MAASIEFSRTSLPHPFLLPETLKKRKYSKDTAPPTTTKIIGNLTLAIFRCTQSSEKVIYFHIQGTDIYLLAF